MKKLLLVLAFGFSAQEVMCSAFRQRVLVLRNLAPKRTIYHGSGKQEKDFAQRMVDSVFLAGLVGFGVNALYNKITNDGELARIEAKQDEILKLLHEIRLDHARHEAVSATMREAKFPFQLPATAQMASPFANVQRTTDQAEKAEPK